MLQKMTGLDLCKAIRKQILTHQYSLTARDTVHETIEGIKGCKWLY
jgi:DNA-binding response OmpR family regulator